jgi:hypothetical protein
LLLHLNTLLALGIRIHFPKHADLARSRVFEKLGGAIVNGIYADGYRSTTSLGNSQTASIQTSTLEEWLSPEVRICVRKTYIDPRSSSEPHEIDRIVLSRSNPDPRLFQLPDGYQVVDTDAQTFTPRHRTLPNSIAKAY